MTAQLILWVIGGLAALGVVVWAGVSGPSYLDRYFKRAGKKPLGRLSLIAITAIAEAVFALFSLSDAFIIATLPLVGLFELLAVVDARTKKLPNVLTFLAAISLAFGGIVGMLVRLIAFHESTSIVGVVAGIAIWLVPVWMLNFMGGGVGKGDVKLAPILGGWLGLYGAGVSFGGFLTALIIGGVYALVLLVTGKANLHTSVAFGPALVAGAMVAWFIAGGATVPW